MMSDLEQIRFQKLSIAKFSSEERIALLKELKKRNISCRTTTTDVIFDERYLREVKDLIPASLR